MRTPNWIYRWLPGPVRVRALRKRYDVLNYFAARRNYHTYLEIGTANGYCMQRVDMTERTGVDPHPRCIPPSASSWGRRSRPAWDLQRMTSDQFFHQNHSVFDMVFIDGLHWAEQVLRDIYNSLRVLRPGGAILLHDCNPQTEIAQLREVHPEARHWNGDTWKAIVFLRRSHPELFTRVLDFDHGIGVVIPRDNATPPAFDDAARADALFAELTYEVLEQNRVEMLGLLPSGIALERDLARERVWAA